MEGTTTSCMEVAGSTKQALVRDPNGGLLDSKEFSGKPLEEASRPHLCEFSFVRVDAQEPRNLLAHLLNRGSSLE